MMWHFWFLSLFCYHHYHPHLLFLIKSIRNIKKCKVSYEDKSWFMLPEEKVMFRKILSKKKEVNIFHHFLLLLKEVPNYTNPVNWSQQCIPIRCLAKSITLKQCCFTTYVLLGSEQKCTQLVSCILTVKWAIWACVDPTKLKPSEIRVNDLLWLLNFCNKQRETQLMND